MHHLGRITPKPTPRDWPQRTGNWRALIVLAFAGVGGSPDQECAQLVEHGRIGSLDGALENSFTEINSIAVTESGTVYVNDAHELSIREFGADGKFVRWIGRDGEGPGEFRSIAGVSILPDGRLAAWDRGNRRITVFAAGGEYEDAIRTEGVNPPYPFVDRTFLTDSAGRYYLRIFANPPSVAPDQSDMARVRYGYLRLSPDGTVLDTIVAPRAMPRVLAEPIVIYTHAGDRSPFPEQVLDALSPFGHLVAGHNGTYAFSILDPSGTIEVEREGFQPVEVKADERAQWRARVAFAERRSGMSFRDVPTRKPAYRDLWVGPDGRIWIHRYAEAVDSGEPIRELWLDYLEGDEPRITWTEPSLYDVYSADGQPLYCVQAPADAEVVTSRGSLVWGILRGALDEEYVVSWRIE